RQFRHGQSDPGTDFMGTLAAGARVQRHPCRWSRDAAALPGAAVAVEFGEDRRYQRTGDCGTLDHLRLR
ncbi:hypothetical protein COLO4_00975, partial [Corchorus olitorius]